MQLLSGGAYLPSIATSATTATINGTLEVNSSGKVTVDGVALLPSHVAAGRSNADVVVGWDSTVVGRTTGRVVDDLGGVLGSTAARSVVGAICQIDDLSVPLGQCVGSITLFSIPEVELRSRVAGLLIESCEVEGDNRGSTDGRSQNGQ